MRVWPRVEFDAIGAKVPSTRDLCEVGLEKQAGADAGVAELCQHVAEPIHLAREVPSRIRGQYVRRIGHQRRLRRADAKYEVEEFGTGKSFDVELHRQHRGEIEYVLKRDMPRVGPRMNRYPVASSGDTRPRRRDHDWDVSTARLSYQRNLTHIGHKQTHLPITHYARYTHIADTLA